MRNDINRQTRDELNKPSVRDKLREEIEQKVSAVVVVDPDVIKLSYR